MIIVANNLRKNGKKFIAEVHKLLHFLLISYVCRMFLKVIISLSDKHCMDNVPHLLKLTNEALLDSKLKSSLFIKSSHEKINTSPSIKRNVSPVFVKDGLLHSLHQSSRASSCDSLVGSLFTDSDSSYDSGSSNECMSCDELSPTSGSYADKHCNAMTTTGRVRSISVRSEKRRRCSREQRKSLMQHMHIARCKKEKIHTGMN